MKKSFITLGLLLPLFIIIVILIYINTQKQPISNPNTENTASTNPDISQQPYPEDRFSSTTTFKIFDDPDADFTMEYPATWEWRKIRTADNPLIAPPITSSTVVWIFSYKNIDVASVFQNYPMDDFRTFQHRISQVIGTNDSKTNIVLEHIFLCPEDVNHSGTKLPELGKCEESIPPLSRLLGTQIKWWPGVNISSEGELKQEYQKIKNMEHTIYIGDISPKLVSDVPGFFPFLDYMARSIKIKK